MRAQYDREKRMSEMRLPELAKANEVAPIGKSPVNRAYFTEKYDKMRENTKLKKEIE